MKRRKKYCKRTLAKVKSLAKRQQRERKGMCRRYGERTFQADKKQ